MPPKTLINQNLLLRLSKITPFQIRNKPKSYKMYQAERQPKNPDQPFAPNREIQVCIDLVQNQLKKDPQSYKDLLERVGRLLIEVKLNWQPMGWQTIEPEGEYQELPSNRGIRKSSSRYLSKNKLEMRGDFEIPEGPFFTEKCGTQIKKNKLIKVKIGKQNIDRLVGQQQGKIDKFASKLEQTQTIMRSQKQEIQKLKQQLQNLLESNQQLKKQKDQLGQQKKELKIQIQGYLEQKIRNECAYEEKIGTLQRTQRQMRNENSALLGCLKEREKQIMAIWQLQAF